MNSCWHADPIDSVEELFEKLNDYRRDSSLVFRGQSDARWPLRPKIDRELPLRDTTADLLGLEKEQELIKRFTTDASRFLPPLERSYMNRDPVLRLTVMQHFCAPTRLIDWTASAPVAAYFACAHRTTEEGSVFWMKHDRLSRVFSSAWDAEGYPRTLDGGQSIDYNIRIFDHTARALVGPIFFTDVPFSRAHAQRGLFTICTRLGELHDDVIRRMMTEANEPSDTYGRITIPAILKEPILEKLEHVGIDASSTHYPGADILGLKMSENLFNERKNRNGS